MDKVYLAVSSDYDNQCTVAVFSTQELADKYCELDSGGGCSSTEEWVVDEYAEKVIDGLMAWSVVLADDRSVKACHQVGLGMQPYEQYFPKDYSGKPAFLIRLFAASAESAIQQARDRFNSYFDSQLADT